LFSEYTVNVEEKTITIQVHEKFEYILNKMLKEGNYTKFELIEFVNLKSSYSKNMFKLLKQWEIKKERKFDISEFRNILDIPPKYRMSEIDKKILTPIMQELGQLFSNLKLEKIKTGRNVTGLKFLWSNTKLNSKLKNSEIIDIIEVSDKLNKVIEKVKKNRFIAPLLTIDNIEILVEMFQEKDLIKGLNWSYKEIKQEIKSLNYLIKSIKTGMEKKEKKLVVKTVPEIVQEQEIKEEILKENNIDLEKDQELKITEIEKIKITKDEYEELYKKFLQEQNTEHNLLTRKGFDIANKNKYEIVEAEIEDIIYQLTIEELKKIPFEELLGKKVEIIPTKDPTKKRYLTCNKDLDDENISFEVTEEIFHLDRIEHEKLLSKTGKLLTGGALYARLKKIAREQNIKIQYGDEIINGKEGK
ncbi:replication initiation protein, partial [Cetobacterium sp.]|uniref:replication initiation protein n=1 Tax=Cetobacterium sp. TaxID=2071632 RepID=UPI003EE7B1E7